MIITIFQSFIIFCIWSQTSALLYPQDSETREVRSLDGLWWFVLEPANSVGYGFLEKWWKLDLSLMQNASMIPVPSSYNDLGTSVELRDHVGWAWYQRQFYVPSSWKGSRVVIRFGSVNYFSVVWVNGKLCTTHTGGHLPFETDISEYIDSDGPSVVTVAVNNTLNYTTIPPADFQYKSGSAYPKGYFIQTPNFDFFNYAGIQRSVWIYRTPKLFIDDIAVKTDIVNHWIGLVYYSISVGGHQIDWDSINLTVSIFDKANRMISENRSAEGQIKIPNANLWWPRGMNQTVGYMYTMKVDITFGKRLLDRYRLQIGVRTVQLDHDIFKINGVAIYLKGCGMHEDSDVRGRGFDYAMMIKDMNLLEWLGANSFRTSHYPYSEERMMETDRRGIMVIAETPAVGLSHFTSDTLRLHRRMLNELIWRDRNHPSVVMWSLANEPRTDHDTARPYFHDLVDLAHALDVTRSVMTVYGPTNFDNDKTADLMDVVGINRYFGWYTNMGQLQLITNGLVENLRSWRQTFHKPMLVTEYGADSVVGLYSEPPTDFTESYQVALMKETHQALDTLASQGFLIGEMFWNFADFMTAQTTTRVYGNRKGVFTRNRQPKMAAYLMKNRYSYLSSSMVNKHEWTNDTFQAIDANILIQFL